MSDTTNEKGLFPSILDALTNAYDRFVGTFKKNGVMICTVIMMLFIVLWTFIINPINVNNIIQKHFEMQYEMQQREQEQKKLEEIQKEKKKFEESIKRREDANYFVSELMLNIITHFTETNRVILLEKHNGNSNIRGIDFLYSSATYELVNENIPNPTYLYDDLQKQTNINLLGVNTIQTLKHRDFIFFKDLAKEQGNNLRLLRKLNDVGDKQSIIFSFKDSNHRPIILLIISGKKLNVDAITSYIEQYKDGIEKFLIN